MDWKKAGAIFLFSILCFTPYLFRETVFGSDSYYYMDSLGLSVSFVKIAAFLCFLASSFLIALIGEKRAKHGWLAFALSASWVLWIPFFYGFEDEVLAFPFLLASVWFCLDKKWIGAVFLLGLAFLISKISFVFSLALIPFNLVFGIPLVFALAGSFFFFFIRQGLVSIVSVAAQESRPVWNALLWAWLWIPVYFYARGIKKIDSFSWMLLVLCVLGFVNGKFAFFAVPFLAMELIAWVEKIPKKNRGGVAVLLVFFSSVMFGVSLWAAFWGPPIKADLSLIQDAGFLAWAEERPLKNTWSVGYWVEHELPGRATAWGGGEGWDKNYAGAFVLAGAHEAIDCPLITKEQNIAFYLC